jgi:uncharacterized protein (TIGR03083 family)
MSHLGSGAVISEGRLEQAFGGPEVEAQPIWDEWNAKDADAMVQDALAANQALLDRIDALSDDERSQLEVDFGPMRIGYDQFLAFRLNEQAVHTWDIEVAADPTAALQADAVPVVLDALPMMAGFAGKPTGSVRDIVVTTSFPDRTFLVALGEEGVTVSDTDAPADLTLPAEALVRLVYGRLDPDHTPAFEGDGADLDELRKAFPGI